MLDLNYHESAALIDAHAKRCELHTEAESAHAETVAQISLHNGWCNTELTQGVDGEIGKGIGGTLRSFVPTSKRKYSIRHPYAMRRRRTNKEAIKDV